MVLKALSGNTSVADKESLLTSYDAIGRANTSAMQWKNMTHMILLQHLLGCYRGNKTSLHYIM